MSREPGDKVQSLHDLDNHIEKYQYWAKISDPKHGTDLKFGTAAPLRVSLIDRIESGEVPPELFKEVKPLEQEVKDMIQEIERSLPISEKDQAMSQAIEWKIHDKERMGEDVREALLSEYEKTHTERGLAFERDFERGEISGLSESSAREYLGAALEARTERASGQDEAKQEMDR